MSTVKIISALVLVSLMLATGLQVNLSRLKEVLANYSLLLRALLANFVLVPIYAVILTDVLHVSPMIAAGIILMAIAPGVPFVVESAGRKKGGSLGLAVTLAFIMPALSVVTVPLTAALLLPHTENPLPMGQFFRTLILLQLIPLLVGMFVVDRVPAVASKLTRPLLLLFAISVVALLILLSGHIVKSVATIYGSYGIIAAFVVVLLSIVTGWLLGGPQREFRRTLGIGTALRNIGLAATLASAMFPDSDVISAVMSYFVVQVIVTVALGAYYSRTTKPLMTVAHDV